MHSVLEQPLPWAPLMAGVAWALLLTLESWKEEGCPVVLNAEATIPNRVLSPSLPSGKIRASNVVMLVSRLNANI